MPTAVETALSKIPRQVVTRNGYNGLRTLLNDLSALAGKNQRIEVTSFRSELQRCGVSLLETEWRELIKALSDEASLGVSLQSFVNAMMVTLRGSRLEAVDKAYTGLSPEASTGNLKLEALLHSYNADGHPWVREKKKASKEVLAEFCGLFNTTTNPTGVVTEAEFFAYYAGLSVVVDSDSEFVRIVSGTWSLRSNLLGGTISSSGSGSTPAGAPTSALSRTALSSTSATGGRSKFSPSQLCEVSTDRGKQYLRRYLDVPRTAVFLDITIGNDEKLHRIVIELLYEAAPKTCENFRCLCTGERGFGRRGVPLHYKGTRFHRIVPGLLVQAGDIVSNDGCSGESIYGRYFDDECFVLPHDKPGVVSMVNMFGPNTNSSQFFITTAAASYLNDRNVAFGVVVDGWEALRLIEGYGTEHGVPFEDVIIQDCGQLD